MTTSTSRTTTQRGYGSSHQAERKRWEPLVQAGGIVCRRCDQPIEPAAPWDLGHNDERTAWTGPEHQACNRAAGARAGNANRGMTIRQW